MADYRFKTSSVLAKLLNNISFFLSPKIVNESFTKNTYYAYSCRSD